MRIKLEHLSEIRGFSSRPGLCRPRTRDWFKRYGLDWDDFRKNGIEADALLATGDGFALEVVRQVTELEAARGR